jgi:hypothetical protein
MRQTPATRLGPTRSSLGGMGEVYRARDACYGICR